MGLKESQAALARLLTETKLREQFFAAPESVGAQMGLTPEESHHLQSLTAPTAETMARSLQNKRRNEVTKLLPRTCVLLNKDFAPLFRQFAADFTPRSVNKPREDALAFAKFLRQCEALRKCPAWRRDLLRYETARLQSDGRRFLARLFLHDAQAITTTGADTQNLRFHPSVILWLQFSPKSARRIVRLQATRKSDE